MESGQRRGHEAERPPADASLKTALERAPKYRQDKAPGFRPLQRVQEPRGFCAEVEWDRDMPVSSP